MSSRLSLADRAITLGVTGGIAAYKSAEIVRHLRRMGVCVQVVMTPAATHLMSPQALAALSGNAVATELFRPHAGAGLTPLGFHPGIDHIELSRNADLIVVAPATANILGKVASGIADDLLSTTIMASSAPVLFAPAMNTRMWTNPVVQANVASLREKGYLFVGPAAGDLACGEEGPGRMAEPEQIIDIAVQNVLNQAAGLRVLVTAGPTEEQVDPVRVLSNRSSGKMGVAIAEAARNRGHKVTMIAGPLRCNPPLGVDRIHVHTAQEMQAEVAARESQADVLIMAAAVADYRPRTPSKTKIPSGSKDLALELTSNPDILAAIGPDRLQRGVITIGFALEIGDSGVEKARHKLEAKGLDMIVLNDATRADSAFGAETTRVTFLLRSGPDEALPVNPKAVAAAEIVRRGEALWETAHGASDLS
ncbi:MAG: bifunctional phosphopantothenoylcysteine decarboxylase/phosphopantothenate--cysteine ligase CoaBC [Candidatus Eisenbacteria sp.]|nr:bifunctional phosphopantothenoylcysteine decarboxylase/phosphopantothenate--cysteine ligase CoaBC [Candidatus Eisenbacteria bacterium]